MSTRELTGGQIAVLVAAVAPMLAVGGLGGWATYTNVDAEFGRSETALGVVAAGEGLVLVLALVLVLLTMFGQTAPAVVRAGLWGAPIAATTVGLSVADTLTEAVVYAVTPMAMCGAAEGLGLVARRIVIYRTRHDAETARRNAAAARALAFHQARARSHPSRVARWHSQRTTWRLARVIGAGDTELSDELLNVQRARITEGADTALGAMMGSPAPAPAVEAPTPAPERHSAREVLRRRFAEMDPEDVIRVVGDAHPDAAPAELASLLIEHGVVVDAVDVVLVLGRPPARATLERDDADDANDDANDAPQVTPLPAPSKAAAILTAAEALGPDAKAADIVARVGRINGITTDAPYVRTVLSRARPTKKDQEQPRPMEGGYA
ncbi:conjugal transfer protein [Streptomyces sp. NPDC046316]|uniref:conjugal transfer protein n=1 Tax=Streptomyces sp. NPDC046316 TaxID=3154494 RepID=UPI0033C95BFA